MPAIAYERRGEGAPLILIHALGADRHVWDPVLDALARERDVVAVDLPGFGASPALPPGAPPTPAALAGSVRTLSGELGLDRPHVAGISLGGWVALELGLAGDAASVTAISAAGLWPRPLGPKPAVARAIAHRARHLLPAVLATARGRRLALAGTVGRPDRVPPAAALHLIRAYADSPGFVEVNAAMRAGRFTALDRIRVPLTLAWGELDRLVAPPAHVPPTARTVTLHGCGHVPTWDDPELVARVVLEGSSRPVVSPRCGRVVELPRPGRDQPMPDLHVIPSGERWNVKQENGDVVSTHDTQAEAEHAAKDNARANGGGEVFTHRDEGEFSRIRKGEAV